MFNFRNATSLVAAGLLVTLASSASSFAQAWTYDQGAGSVTIAYNHTTVENHLFSDGRLDGVDALGVGVPFDENRLAIGTITGDTVQIRADYGLLDRLAVNLDLVFVTSTYDGDVPDSEADLTRTSDFGDMGIGLRYAATQGPVILTPYVRYGAPSNNYVTLGHTAPGIGLDAFQFGVAIGATIPGIPSFYSQVSYSYAWVEDVADFSMDRSQASVELGYFITDKIAVRGLALFLRTHGGLDWFDATDDDFHLHDTVAQARNDQIGFGIQYTFSPKFDLTVGYIATVSGQNTHDAKGLVMGTNLNF